MTQSSRPLRIGMSACFFHADPQRAIFKGKTLIYAEESMVRWVMSRGDIVYMLPTFSETISAEDLLADVDALVLQGGSDVSPSTYGEKALRPEWNGDAIRDQYEIALLKAAMKLDRPVIGLCRGLQLINAGLGGTLYQDIGTQLDTSLNHRNWDIYDQNFHEVSILPDTHLHRLYEGQTSGTINSIHHQSIKDLAPDFVVEATSPQDDIIEAIRYIGPSDAQDVPYIMAVQWHPEFHDRTDESILSPMPLLDDFLHIARQKKERRKA